MIRICAIQSAKISASISARGSALAAFSARIWFSSRRMLFSFSNSSISLLRVFISSPISVFSYNNSLGLGILFGNIDNQIN